MKSRRANGLRVMVGVFLLAVIVTAGAQASARRSSYEIPLLRWGMGGTYSTTDPAKFGFGFGSSAESLEFLLKLGPTGNLLPNLALSITQPGPAVYVYHLRHGVKFWDGNEMTSADVANALNYERYPTSVAAAYFTSVKSITATDRYTVAVTMKHRDATWAKQLATSGPIFEKSFQDAHKTTMGNPGVLIVGTGPFVIDSLDPTVGGGIELSANPHWWGGPVPVKHISLKFFSDETAEALAMRAGAIDVTFPSVAASFASTSGLKIISVPGFPRGYFAMNTRMAPWNDVHVRRAVAYALNRAELAKLVGPDATPINYMILPKSLRELGSQAQVDAALKGVPTYPFSLAKAKAELAKSKYPNGFTATTFTLDFGEYTPETEAIVGQLQKIGINLKIDHQTFAQFIATAFGPKTAIPAYFGTNTEGSVETGDPAGIGNWLFASKQAGAGGWNFANYSNPNVDALMADGVRTLNPTKRLAIYGKILKIVSSDVPYDPLYTKSVNLALSPKFTFKNFNVFSFFTDWPLSIRPK
jgi:peptide/nickel transport system substrate-binding protein